MSVGVQGALVINVVDIFTDAIVTGSAWTPIHDLFVRNRTLRPYRLGKRPVSALDVRPAKRFSGLYVGSRTVLSQIRA